MNGNAMPSLQPDSADRISRKCLGTRLANLPLPTTDDARTGSVAVTQAEHTRLSSQFSGTAFRQPPNSGKFFGGDLIQGVDIAFDQDENDLQQG